jgi:uncharacterized membrane protein
MRRLLRYFLQGISVLVPVGLTIYLVLHFVLLVDGKVHEGIESLFGWNAVGLGWPIVLAAILLAGWMVDLWVFRRVWKLLDATLEKIPLVKSVYGGIRDILGFLFGEKKSFSRVVVVDVPGAGAGAIGMVTNEEPWKQMGPALEGRVAVYVPMAFNLGGYTLFVPPDRLRDLPVTVEEAMGFVLAGGIPRAKTSPGEESGPA